MDAGDWARPSVARRFPITVWRVGSEAGVDGFAFEGEDAEDRFVDAAEGFVADEAASPTRLAEESLVSWPVLPVFPGRRHHRRGGRSG